MSLTSEHTISSRPVMLKGFAVWPGYQKSSDLLAKNAAPRQLQVKVYYGDGPERLCRNDHFDCYYPSTARKLTREDENLPRELEPAMNYYFKQKTFTWTIEKKAGPQTFLLPQPLWAYGARFTIKSIHGGAKYEDCCVSEIKPIVAPFPEMR